MARHFTNDDEPDRAQPLDRFLAEMEVSDDDASLEDDLIRAECAASLHFFVEEFWEVLEPGRPFVDNWHLHWLCDELQAISEGEQTRLLANVPPGAAKSILMVFFTAWEWGPRSMPSLRYLCASYTQTLTIRDNRRRKAILMCDKYKRLWPHVQIDQRRTSDENFGNTNTGWCIATSTGGVGTGERADRIICVPYESMILTDRSMIRIGEIVEQELNAKVAGWNGTEVVWQDIEAYETSPGRSLYEIKHDTGSVRCTGDHPVWTDNRGYVAAEDVRVGDIIRTLGVQALRAVSGDDQGQAEPHIEPSMVLAGVSRDSAAGGGAAGELRAVSGLRQVGVSSASTWRTDAAGSLLQPCVSRSLEPWQPKSWIYRSAGRYLRVVQRTVLQATEKARVLLAGLRDSTKKGRDGRTMAGGESVPLVWDWLYGHHQGPETLLAPVRGSGSRPSDEGRREWPICPRAGRETLSAWLVEDVQGADTKSRQQPVPTVQLAYRQSSSGAGCSPHQLRQRRPGAGQPDHALSVLPWQDARKAKRAFAVDPAVVRSVGEVSGVPDRTFNVRVAPCHNYFADGVLLHNCDDPHSVNTAESDVIRAQTLHWWREVIPTRVNDPQKSAFIVIMQRVHQDDVAGDILDNRGPEWTHVMIPMRYDPSRHCETDNGEDPRTEEGELYWPERFPGWTVDRDSIPLGRWGVAAQFQQLPAPRGGGIIEDIWWKTWPPPDELDRWTRLVTDENGKERLQVAFPPSEFTMAYVDTAFTEQEENAYCAFIRFSIFADSAGRPKVMMNQAWQDRPTLRNLCIRLLADCRKGHVDALVIENKAGANWVKQEMQRLMRAGEFQIILDDPRGDKVARLHSVAPLFEDGVVYAPDRAWADLVISQVSSFPKGKFRDLVDCTSGGLGYLRRNSLIRLSAEFDEDERDAKTFRGNQGGIADLYGVG